MEKRETDQLSRIRYYEEKLDRCTEAIIRLQEALTEFDDAQADFRELERYYTSEDWRRDFEDDEAGLLPEDLKRGVLSEDGVWDALEENAALFGAMKALIFPADEKDGNDNENEDENDA